MILAWRAIYFAARILYRADADASRLDYIPGPDIYITTCFILFELVQLHIGRYNLAFIYMASFCLKIQHGGYASAALRILSRATTYINFAAKIRFTYHANNAVYLKLMRAADRLVRYRRLMATGHANAMLVILTACQQTLPDRFSIPAFAPMTLRCHSGADAR